MNRNLDPYNANFKNSYLLNIALGFVIAPKDLKSRNNKGKLNKE